VTACIIRGIERFQVGVIYTISFLPLGPSWYRCAIVRSDTLMSEMNRVCVLSSAELDLGLISARQRQASEGLGV
jgi:hypothetical protein